jgi:hypothetical protein
MLEVKWADRGGVTHVDYKELETMGPRGKRRPQHPP